ncbi:MAG TPA: dual specificity protein phosphatase [Blastocatellia bacterium]|nr:dual specificity protein phosphatase [Blastocatellia bacterium]
MDRTLDADRINEQIWCGATLDGEDFPLLGTLGINCVINLETCLRYSPQSLASTGIGFVSIPVPDLDQPLSEKFIDAGVAAIEDVVSGGGNVYVHCTAGWQRSPALVACYLVYAGLPAERALALVKQRRPVARFYSSHIASAMRYEARLRKNWQAMKTAGPIGLERG